MRKIGMSSRASSSGGSASCRTGPFGLAIPTENRVPPEEPIYHSRNRSLTPAAFGRRSFLA
jgi:hypothetical protein